jgi:hypothetical protein
LGAIEWQKVFRRAIFPVASPPSGRQIAFGVTLAIFVSYNACLTLGLGLLGSRGNSTATGVLLFGLPLLLLLFSLRSAPRVQLPDFVFAGLVITALLSFLINHQGGESTKEYRILIASLAGYIACRSLLAEDAPVVRSVFERVTAAIVLLGAVFTADEIFRQWNGPPGKPFVFGFNAAGTYFMMSLGFLVIALVTVDMPRLRRTVAISALIFFPAVVFAAAMVRFTFIALAGSLFVAMIMAKSGKRWHVAAVGVTILLAVAVGMTARYSTAKIYAAYVLEETVETSFAKKPAEILQGATEVPSCRLAINTRNSIAIRQALARDAIYFIPTVGLVGTGLDSFLRFSCIKAHQVHISILQAAVEFGWLGGLFLVLLIGIVLYRLFPLAKSNGAVRFVLCSLVFVVLLSLAHGRVSRDSALFALLGCAVGVCDIRRGHTQTGCANFKPDGFRGDSVAG